MKKNILIILIISFISGIFILGYFYTREQVLLKADIPNIENVKVEELENKNYQTRRILESPLPLQNIKVVRVFLEVLDNKYDTQIKENSSVFDLMDKIKKENQNFDFKYKKTPVLGNFITEINEKKGGDGGYWIYYINNKEASVGVSNYILKEGDTVLWKYE